VTDMPLDPFTDELPPAPDEHGWFTNGNLGRAIGVDPRRVALYCSAMTAVPAPAVWDQPVPETAPARNLICTSRGATIADDEWHMDYATAEAVKGVIRSKRVGLAVDLGAHQAWLFLNKRTTDIDGGAGGREGLRAAREGATDATGPLPRADAPTGSVEAVPEPLSFPVLGVVPPVDWADGVVDRRYPPPPIIPLDLMRAIFPEADDDPQQASRFRRASWVVVGCALVFALAAAKLAGWI
jgi:hypothetical protein